METRKTRIWLAVGLGAVVLFFWLEDSLLRGTSQKFPPHKSFEILPRVINLVRNDYVQEPVPQTTMEGAFQGMIGSLDVLSSYLDKPAAAKYLTAKKPSLKDVGVVLYKSYGSFPIVVGLIKGSPAEKAEIKIGDSLTALDDQTTLVWSLSEASLYLKDREKKTVKLRVLQDTSTKEILLERMDLYLQSVTYAPLKDTAGIVSVHHFFPPLTEDFRAGVLPRLKSLKGPLILDLRNCFEGDIEEARKFVNIFFKAEKIGYLEKKGGEKEFLACPEEPALDKMPLVIWVNTATMGASEMVAAALKDSRKARIIGIPTPGLASRQEFFPLDSGDALLLTTGIFCLNSGEKIWGKGVGVDIKLEVERQEDKVYIEKTLGLNPGS